MNVPTMMYGKHFAWVTIAIGPNVFKTNALQDSIERLKASVECVILMNQDLWMMKQNVLYQHAQRVKKSQKVVFVNHVLSINEDKKGINVTLIDAISTKES